MRLFPTSWRHYSPHVLLLLLTFAAYFPLCCRFGDLFTMEDHAQFIHCTVMGYADIIRFFHTSCWGATVSQDGFYRPLMQLQFFLLHRWFGLAAFPLHLSAFLLFAVIVQLVHLFAFCLFRRRGIALLAAVLFCINPTTTRTLFFGHNSGDLPMVVFIMLTLICCLRDTHPLLIAGMMLGAFAGKEGSYVLPVLILLYEIIVRRLTLLASCRKHQVMLVLATVFFGFRLILFNGLGGYGPGIHRLGADAAGQLAEKLLLCATCYHPAFFPGLATLLIMLLVLRFPRRPAAEQRRLVFLWLALLISFLPIASMYITARHAITGLLFPIIMFVTIIATGLNTLRTCFRPAGIVNLLLVLLLLAIAIPSWPEREYWYRTALPRNRLIADLTAQLARCPTAQALIIIAPHTQQQDDFALESLNMSVRFALWSAPEFKLRPAVFFSLYDVMRQPGTGNSLAIYHVDDQQQVTTWSREQLLAFYRFQSEYQTFQEFAAAETCTISPEEVRSIADCRNPLIYTALLDSPAIAASRGRKRLLFEYLLSTYTNGESFAFPWWRDALLSPVLAAEADLLFADLLARMIFDQPRQLDMATSSQLLQQPNLPERSAVYLAAHLYRQHAISKQEFITRLPRLDDDCWAGDRDAVIRLISRLDDRHEQLWDDALREKYVIAQPGDVIARLHYSCQHVWNRPDLPCRAEHLFADNQPARRLRHR